MMTTWTIRRRAAGYTEGSRPAWIETMYALRRTLAQLPPVAGDTVLTLLAAASVIGHQLIPRRGPEPWPGSTIALGLLCAAALLLRSRWPSAALVLVGCFGALYLATGNHFLGIMPAVLIALYSMVAYSPEPRAIVWSIALGVCLLLNFAEVARGGPSLTATVSTVLLNSGWMAMGILLGEVLRGRHAYARQAELRAREAERVQQEMAQRRVIAERLQIARELHDVLAHTVAVINVQAGVAAHVIDRQPEQARAALVHIKDASRDTLQELRALVGVLRDGDGPGPRAPTAGLDALDDLLASVRAAGLTVAVERCGDQRPLPATVDLAAYRIIQEALTNVIKHAGPARVCVALHRRPDRLEIAVTNERGPRLPLPSDRSGHGLAGMRERAAVLGGSLDAAPRPDGGFEVRATLPVAEAGG
jgi:signal transduction histidine kinase